MPAEDSPASLVARFLRANNYHGTLDTFLLEAGLPPDTGTNPSKNALTIEQILQEKKVFDVSLAFEKINLENERNKAWTTPAPSVPTNVDTLPAASNILHVAVESVCPSPDGEETPSNLLLATGADRTLNFISPLPPFRFYPGKIPVSESPVLSCAFLTSRYCITSSMSGRVALHDLSTGKTLDEVDDHKKYVVKVTSIKDENGVWLATAAWDARILVYHISPSLLAEDSTLPPSLGKPIAELTLQSNPEAVLFLTHPEIATPVLLASRRDSTMLYYYSIPDTCIDLAAKARTSPNTAQLQLLGRQNLAPHSNAWVAFTPSAFALSPRDPSILAVATSAIPIMKLIIVRLLLPPPPIVPSPQTDSNATINTNAHVSTTTTQTSDAVYTPQHNTQINNQHVTQASQTRAALALSDREAAAIQIHVSTSAPQTPYSTPALAWRPDGTGVYVNGDDGVVRGVEASSGKVVSVLRGGHEAGTKVRCLWAGFAPVPAGSGSGGGVEVEEEEKGEREEIVVSGGFDRRLVVWRVEGK